MGAQTDTFALVTLLSNGQADTNLYAGFYASTVYSLALENWHTTTAPLTFTKGTNTVTLDPNLLNILSLISDDGTVMSELSLRELESILPGWRSPTGSPYAYTLEAENKKTTEVYPEPALNSTGTAIYTEVRTDVLYYLVLPVALRMMYREYSRESDHQDTELAAACQELSDLLFKMLKVS